MIYYNISFHFTSRGFSGRRLISGDQRLNTLPPQNVTSVLSLTVLMKRHLKTHLFSRFVPKSPV